MTFISTRPRVLAVGAVCAAAGAGAGTVAVAGASTAHHPAAGANTRRAALTRPRALVRLARRTVHGELTVRTRTGFQTVTIDRGVIDAVNGDVLTMTDGTPTASDQRVTLTIPSGASVRNGQKAASLTSLTSGERVIVVRLPQRTVVVARPGRAGTGRS
jgi:hypothetical protein